jgi:hypothetical protein
VNGLALEALRANGRKGNWRRERGLITCFYSDPGIIHMAPNVRKNLCLQTKLADGLAVQSGLFRRGGGGEFDVLDAECIEGFGDGDLGLGVKEGICKLFSLYRLRTEVYRRE